MANRNKNRMTLNTVGYTPAVFNAIEYKPLVQDYSGLERSFARNEERRKNLKEQESAIDVALGKIESQLYNNPEMQTWFVDYKNKIKQDINEAAKIGDYAGALNTAIRTAGNIMQDTQLIGRMKASAEFQDKVNEVHKMKANGNIDAATEKWWLENNQFKYEDIEDGNGNVVSGTTYSTLPTPVAQINVADYIAKAFQMNTSEKTNGETFNQDGSITRTSSDLVTEETIRRGTKDLIDATPGAKEALIQDYEVDKYTNNPRAKNNGVTMSFEDYINKRISEELISNLSYDYYDRQTVNMPKGNGSGSYGNLLEDHDLKTYFVAGKPITILVPKGNEIANDGKEAGNNAKLFLTNNM